MKEFLREQLSHDHRYLVGTALGRAADKSSDALASDVLGSSAAKHILRLWAEAGLSDEAVRLLVAWEALAQGCDDLDYYYADLYPLLYRCNGSEFEQTETGGHILKSSCRKKVGERIARFEAEQEAARITFANHTPGYIDKDKNTVRSHVTLYSRQFVAECLELAESLPGYTRGKKEARNSAIRKFVAERSGSGIAYIRKPPKRSNKSKQIADGWKRVQGNMQATIKRMEDRGDSSEIIAKTALEYIDPRIIIYIRRQERTEIEAEQATFSSDLIRKEHEVTPQVDFGVTSKQGLSDAGSINDSARFSKTCNNSNNRFDADDAVVEPLASSTASPINQVLDARKVWR